MTDKEKEYRTERMVRTAVECNKLTLDCVTTGQVARRLKMTAKGLYKRLQELDIMFKDSGLWMLSPRFNALNLVRYRYIPYYTMEGEFKMRVYPVWTPDGVEFILHNA